MSGIGGAIRLGMFFLKAMTDPEGAAIDAIDALNEAPSEDLNNLKSAICRKLNCTDISIKLSGENKLRATFTEVSADAEEFAIRIGEMAYKLMENLPSAVFSFVPIEDVKKSIRVVIDKSDVHIEVTVKNPVKLPVKKEDNAVYIEIPVHSERIIEKLKEVGGG